MKKLNQTSCFHITIIGFLILFMALSMVNASELQVNFNKRSTILPDLTHKFGCQNTALVQTKQFLRDVKKLSGLNFKYFRQEVAIGKDDTPYADIVSGSYPFTFTWDPLYTVASAIHNLGLQPIFAWGYEPKPLFPGDWKHAPDNYEHFQFCYQKYAEWAKQLNLNAFHEVWNEPDSIIWGNVFFDGQWTDYLKMYSYAAFGLKKGDSEAPVMGYAASTAQDPNLMSLITDFLHNINTTSAPFDFFDLHSYGKDNFVPALQNVRKALKQCNLANHQIIITEINPFTDITLAELNHYSMASRVFSLIDYFLQEVDTPIVIWSECMDWGTSSHIGLIDHDGHIKASYNAFAIYGRMPINRTDTIWKGNESIGVIASSQKNCSGLIIFSQADIAITIDLIIEDAPFDVSDVALYRIDAQHSSYYDNPNSESLQQVQQWSSQSLHDWNQTFNLPQNAVVYFEFLKSST